MLIPKENFIIVKFFAAWLAVLLACSIAAAAQAARPAHPAHPAHPAPYVSHAPYVSRAPDAVAAEFYGWYLNTLSADQDPLSDRYAIFTRYVAQDLAAQLVDRLKRGHLPADDYFIQSADYRHAWLHSVHAALVRQSGRGAEVVVTLGKDGGPMRVLGLLMVLENGAWKIRHVTLVGSDFAKSSADQSVI